MSKIKVNAISNRIDEGAPELSRGATFGSSSVLDVAGNVNITGVSTANSVIATNVNVVGVITGTFSGNASQMVGLPVITAGKSVALRMILDPVPFRA